MTITTMITMGIRGTRQSRVMEAGALILTKMAKRVIGAKSA